MSAEPTRLEVRVEKLPPIRVARFHALGRSPESEAWARLRAWAKPRGLLQNCAANPVFGFNNPSPSQPDTEYGYELWIGIDPETQIESGVEIQNFSGGWYAVTTCQGLPNPAIWMQLFGWMQTCPHRHRSTHELERVHDPLAPESKMRFDLYLPIEEPALPPHAQAKDVSGMRPEP